MIEVGGKGDRNNLNFRVPPKELKGGNNTDPKLAYLNALHNGRALGDASRTIQENVFAANIIENKLNVSLALKQIADVKEDKNNTDERLTLVEAQLLLLSQTIIKILEKYPLDELINEQLLDKIINGIRKARTNSKTDIRSRKDNRRFKAKA